MQFIAADIARFDRRQLPDFDYVTLHGLYAWVPLEVQAAIRAFLATKLRPGGLVYLSYNALPGWGSVSPLREYFVGRAAVLGGEPLELARRIVAELAKLKEQGAPFFHENPAAAGIVTRLEASDPRYIVHEYLGPSWYPKYFTEVHDELSACGLAFVGDTAIVENLLPHSVKPAFVEGLQALDDRRERESRRDFIQNRFFRRDVYRKPGGGSTIRSPNGPLGETLFSLIAHPIQVPDTINITDAPAVKYAGPWFERIKRLLGHRVLSLDELLQTPGLAEGDPAQYIDNLTLLTVGGFCVPCATRETEPPRGPSDFVEVVPRLNAVLLERLDWTAPAIALASPVLGSGVTLNALEAALLRSLHQRESIDWLADQFERAGIAVRADEGKRIIDDPAQARAALEEAMQAFLRYKLPKLAYLGVVVPAG